MTRAILATLAALVLLQPTVANLDAQAPPLGFFTNYFLTGDYVVEGVGLHGSGAHGRASADIVVSGVPAGADVAAAFLYWQAVGPLPVPEAGARGVTFRGHALESAEGPFAKVLGTGSPSCWGGGNRVYTYRADVLRFLDIDPSTGKLTANGTHRIEAPDGRSVATLGASLVVVYRDPTLPLSAIVLYDGTYTMGPEGSMALTIGGFYDPATAAKLTHVVGSGQPERSENLTYEGTRIAVNPFASSLGRFWDNPTFTLAADPARREVTTGADTAGLETPDCLTWGAVVYRTTVKDGDGDGLLDVWETTEATITDPNGRPLPNLKAMGATPDRKDLFVEIGYLKTDAAAAYGGVVKPAHSHLPSPAALRLVGDMFAGAPAPIAVHFDVGDDYPIGEADPYVIRGAGLARGGEWLDESATVCTPEPTDAPWVCQFSAHPGTIGWKTGFRFVRDQVLAGPPALPGEEDPCDAPGNTCERRFDQNRHHAFHYVLFAHALGLPKAELPCLDGSGTPVNTVGGQCAVQPNPEFRVPRTNTGVGDFPGGDAIVSLGAFADAAGLPIGTPFMQASTLAHELGHNAERRHGGEALEPNCKPTYPSVMNYLYQLRGLPDDLGIPHLDFSSGLLGVPVDETVLTDGETTASPYRLGWYAPLATSYLAGRSPAALTHCDGSPLLTGANGGLLEAPMVRIDARTAASPRDWNADGDLDATPFAQDVNFNGRANGGVTAPLLDADDWNNLRLDQVGSRRNVGGLYVEPGSNRLALGPLSLSVGKGDLGKGDLGKGDLSLGKGDLAFGKGDLGKGDLGKGDLGKGDLAFGKGDLAFGKGDLGKGDLGGGDLFLNDPNNPPGELDFETASGLARTPPNQFAACVAGGAGCTDLAAGLDDVLATWTTPNVGGVAQFTVYRVAGPALLPGQIWTPVAEVPAVSGQQTYTAIDAQELTDGAAYTYFAVATYDDGVRSDPSNLVTITAVNLPARAGDDSYSLAEDVPLVQAAPGVLANDGDPDSDLAFVAQLVSAPLNGTLVLAADGAFVYTPAPNYAGPDSFTYRAVSGSVTTNTATVSLAVAAVDDAPEAFDIADVTIDKGGSTGPIAFTIVDEDPATAVVSATASNASLVPPSGIVLGGAGALRTVTVTPVPGGSGTAVITVRVTDAGGQSVSDTFTVTVRASHHPGSHFVHVHHGRPSTAATLRAGGLVPMLWHYASGTTPVDSGFLLQTVTVRGPLPDGPTRTFTNADPSRSWLRYGISSRAWSFSLLTRDAAGHPYPAGAYEVVVTPGDPRFAPATPFQIRLK